MPDMTPLFVAKNVSVRSTGLQVWVGSEIRVRILGSAEFIISYDIVLIA